jgi:hypothetical protein
LVFRNYLGRRVVAFRLVSGDFLPRDQFGAVIQSIKAESWRFPLEPLIISSELDKTKVAKTYPSPLKVGKIVPHPTGGRP